MSINIGDKPVNEFTNDDLLDWINEKNTGNKLRKKTAFLWLAIIRAFDFSGAPMTVRQMFYQLVSMGAVPKTENAYNQVGYHLLQLRRREIIPYGFISDNTRWMRKPNTYESLEDFLKISQDAYRRTLWANQDHYVEIWCEKDALAGVISEITEKWDVPLMVTRGFPSETFVYEAAQVIKAKNEGLKIVNIYYFGDYDPSGVAIPVNIQKKLEEFGAYFIFDQTAINPSQIYEYDLPTRPTKRTDSRAKNWEGGSVELDALPTPVLRELVETCITRHIDQYALAESQKIEALEQETLTEFVNNFGLARN